MFASIHRHKITKFLARIKFPLFLATPILAYWIYAEGRGRFFITGNYLSFYSQWRPSVLIYTLLISCTVYLLTSRLNTCKLFTYLADLSFFVYFVHIYIMETVWKLILPYVSLTLVSKIWFDLLFFLSVAGISFLLASLFHRFKRLRSLLG
jgi:hypothetical protein